MVQQAESNQTTKFVHYNEQRIRYNRGRLYFNAIITKLQFRFHIFNLSSGLSQEPALTGSERLSSFALTRNPIRFRSFDPEVAFRMCRDGP